MQATQKLADWKEQHLQNCYMLGNQVASSAAQAAIERLTRERLQVERNAIDRFTEERLKVQRAVGALAMEQAATLRRSALQAHTDVVAKAAAVALQAACDRAMDGEARACAQLAKALATHHPHVDDVTQADAGLPFELQSVQHQAAAVSAASDKPVPAVATADAGSSMAVAETAVLASPTIIEALEARLAAAVAESASLEEANAVLGSELAVAKRNHRRAAASHELEAGRQNATSRADRDDEHRRVLAAERDVQARNETLAGQLQTARSNMTASIYEGAGRDAKYAAARHKTASELAKLTRNVAELAADKVGLEQQCTALRRNVADEQRSRRQADAADSASKAALAQALAQAAKLLDDQRTADQASFRADFDALKATTDELEAQLAASHSAVGVLEEKVELVQHAADVTEQEATHQAAAERGVQSLELLSSGLRGRLQRVEERLAATTKQAEVDGHTVAELKGGAAKLRFLLCESRETQQALLAELKFKKLGAAEARATIARLEQALAACRAEVPRGARTNPNCTCQEVATLERELRPVGSKVYAAINEVTPATL
jgi:hypothetical protein